MKMKPVRENSGSQEGNRGTSQDRKLNILQIAPVYIPITLEIKYGGIERVVLALGKEFDKKGHNVTTAAPADSNPYGTLFPTLPKSEWTKPKIEGEDPNAYEKHVSKIINYILENNVDIVHDHTGNFVLTDLFKESSEKHSKMREIPFIVTPHELRRFAKISPPQQDNIMFTSLSEYQKEVFSEYVNVQKVVNNGVEENLYPYQENKGNYLFSLGSIERDKGQDLAVKAALESRMKMKVGGKVVERDFYDLEIKPHHPQVEYVGELNDTEKKEFYKNAKASILPIRIGDCFTLTRIESLACGTPVVTLDTGSAKEAINHGKTGYIVPYNENNEKETINSMSNYINNIDKISNKECRNDLEKRFTWSKVADNYISLYKNNIK